MSEAGFLADIIERPDDDTPRLVYADWLQEHGRDERAELIRVQIERARLDEWDGRQVALARREEALLAEHGRAWAGAAATCCKTWLFRRGMLEEVHATGVDFKTDAPAVFAAHPVRVLRVSGGAAAAADPFHETPAFVRVERLELSGGAAVGGILRSPHWSSLRALSVERMEDGDDGAAALAAAPWAVRLRELMLKSAGMTQEGVRSLLDAGMASLEWLDVSFNNAIGDQGCWELVTGGTMPALRGMKLVHVRLTGRGARRLAGSAALGRLRRLELGHNELGGGGVSALAESRHLVDLEWLDLSSCRPTREGLEALCRTGTLRAVGRLEMGTADIRPGTLRALMENPALSGLHTLDVGSNPVGPDGASLLASADNPWRLRSLDLRFCRLVDDGAAALDTPGMSGLRELILHGNNIEAGGVVKLAAARHLGALRLLGLKNNRVGEAGADALARTGSLDLLKLELETNKLSAEARAALRARYGDGVTFSD